MARIIYALSGQGRGHTSRVIAISDELRRRGHEVMFCCGGTAQEILETQGEPVLPQPNSALWRAAVVPGWGQLYNRQYLKIPLVYGGLAGFTAAALYTNDRYLLYRHAYLFTARENADGSPVFPEYADDYARLR